MVVSWLLAVVSWSSYGDTADEPQEKSLNVSRSFYGDTADESQEKFWSFFGRFVVKFSHKTTGGSWSFFRSFRPKETVARLARSTSDYQPMIFKSSEYSIPSSCAHFVIFCLPSSILHFLFSNFDFRFIISDPPKFPGRGRYLALGHPLPWVISFFLNDILNPNFVEKNSYFILFFLESYFFDEQSKFLDVQFY